MTSRMLTMLLVMACVGVYSLFGDRTPEAPVDNRQNNFRVDYVEFPATDIAAIKKFYIAVFGWKFTDYGPGYTSFEDGRLAGGFNTERKVTQAGTLVVIYASDLEGCEAKVRTNGGKIVKDIFSFPGGRRFEFNDPNGNMLAVWSE